MISTILLLLISAFACAISVVALILSTPKGRETLYNIANGDPAWRKAQQDLDQTKQNSDE